MDTAKQADAIIKHTKAAIFDLDGVITNTASIHAQAWKRMFDEYLFRRQGDYTPMEIATDYPEYIDGKPRYDGVQDFLASRGITLAYGSPEDAPDKETVCGLGNRKNQLFQELLATEGFEIYEDAVSQLKRWKETGIKTAIVSSSKNCQQVIEQAGLAAFFDTRVDGMVSAELGLKGKPHPDIFLEAAQRLDVEPAEAIVFEDAIAGVQAGKAGGFQWVVGIQRKDRPDHLEDHGADQVVRSLKELDLMREVKPEKLPIAKISSALEHYLSLIHI